VAVLGIAAIPAAAYAAGTGADESHKPKDSPCKAGKYKHLHLKCGTLIVETYLAGFGKPPRHEEEPPPPEPNRSRSIGIFRDGELVREVEPTSSQTRFELKPGDYEVRAGCGKARAVVRLDRTSSVKVYCYRK
jgi:hypothetical protein